MIGNKAKASIAKDSKVNTDRLEGNLDANNTEANMAAFSDTGAVKLFNKEVIFF